MQEQLSTLLTAVLPLLSGKPTTQSYHHLSSTCHRLVSPPCSRGSDIYVRIRDELGNSIAGLAREWRASILGKEENWLGNLVKGWRTWESRVVRC